MASLQNILFVVLAMTLCVHSSPLSFPDSQPAANTYQKNGQNNTPQEAITPPPTQEETVAGAAGEDEDPTVAQIVDRVPQILDRIQNYINSAVSSYASNDTATNQPPAQLNQFLTLVDGFLSATNTFAQQFLQPTGASEEDTAEGEESATEPAVAQPVRPVDNNEIVYNEKKVV